MNWLETRDFPGASIPFAVDAHGNWREVDEVQRGLACGCMCPACRGPVVAKQGEERIHHFAHHDRRECRLALESSLFGMLMTLLPTVRLALPGAGDPHELAPEFRSGYRPSSPQWLVPSCTVDCSKALVRTKTLEESKVDAADVELPGIDLHIISLVKRVDRVVFERRTDRHVVGIDLRTYARVWWETCDEDKEARLAEATRAKDLMRSWLEEHLTGRGWLWHADVEARLRIYRAEQERERARLAATRPPRRIIWPPPAAPAPPAPVRAVAPVGEALDPVWSIPTELPGCVSDRWIGTKDGLIRAPLRVMRKIEGAELTTREAANLQLYWHGERQCWFFVGNGPGNVPTPVRAFLKGSPWLPVTPEDERALRGAQV